MWMPFCRLSTSLSSLLCVVSVVFYNKGMALEGEANNINITDNHKLIPQENRRGRSGRGGRGRGRFGGRGGRGRAENKAIADEDNQQGRPSGSSFNGDSVKNETNNHDTEQVKKNGSENTRGRAGGRGRGRISQTNHENENTSASNHNIEDGPQEVYQERGRGVRGRGRGRDGRYGGRGKGRGRYEGRGRSSREGKGSNDTDGDQRADSNIGNNAINERSEGHPPTVIIEATSEQQMSLETKEVTPMESAESGVPVASKPQIDTKSPAVLHLGNKMTRKKGFPVVLSRSNAEASDLLQDLSEKLAQVAVEPLTTKIKKAKKKKEVVKEEETDVEKDQTSPVDATVALQRLPAQEVSITAATQVKMAQQQEAAAAPVETKSTSDKKKKSKKQNPKMQDAKQAARVFNNAVRLAVERGDVQGTRDLLYEKRNHQFALDCNVLETAMKAFIMAALLEDALYCLRNCTLPDTLSVIQAERILQCLPQNLRHSSVFCAGDVIRSLCVVTQLGDKRPYFLRIVRAIALEFLEEATTARDRICSSPCERLVRQGLCIVNVKLERGKKPADLVVKPGDQLGVFIADENRGLQAGDAVSILPYAGPYPLSAESLDRNLIEAVVTSTNPMILRLQDRTNAELYSSLTEPENLYRIDKLANRMGFNRQLAAVTSLCGNDQRVSPELVQAVTAMDENFMTPREATHLGRLTSTAALCATAVGDDDQDSLKAVSRLALEKFNSLEGLNASQQLAVEGAVTNRLTLVQGPPGTGKTAVAIRILQHWAKMDSDVPILATSDSNIAVDNLVEGCANVGLRVIRIGRPEAIRPELLRYCIDREKQTNSVTFYKERSKQLRQAQVICCTCIGSGSEWLDAIGVCPRVLVDEATQATEPAVLVPLMRGCKQLVLVGDHCQLPPTVLSTQAAEEGHGVPLFSRMVACGVPPYMLDTQYRMHPAISQFPSDLFYGGLLQNGVSAPERRPLAGFPWPVPEFPVAFMPIYGQELDDGVSKYNVEEAQAAVQAVQMLLQGGQCTPADIAVVTPYAAQAKFIRRLIRQSIAEFLEVSSVDGFQGREKQAVVFSAVRSNDYGAVGFTSDWRRVNVSFTRARRALIVLGNDTCLRRGDPETWALWLAWADAAGINMDRPGQPRGRYDAEQLRRVRGGTTAAELLKDVLNRQREQIQSQLFHQERAVRNAQGQIMATEEEKPSEEAQLTMEEEVALMENTDGNWDDSDDEAPPMPRNFSKSTLSNSSISRSNTRSSTPTDAWDL
ncbi:hypothetical protein FisN_19Lh318 [Fistulifera solaris]|uniref:Regulator of nonsense transcripts 1 n=1 Tax=Fistulifera solaris TaxID=1519565 RepID=A0A1Z5K8G1_FISSO|nr:hypothetical protein FisN_19Lh318 [Fistulifera solaris]|eukprot:GAX22248.1 hypothetical protein FisN_19Lh318 [Fistulifera solaris]